MDSNFICFKLHGAVSTSKADVQMGHARAREAVGPGEAGLGRWV